MSSPLRNFALFWNLGLCFFLNPVTSPCHRLDWDQQNTDGAPLPLGYSAENFHCPRRLFHERSDGASVILVFGYHGVDIDVSGPEPVSQTDGFLRLWLTTFAASVSWMLFQVFLESVLSPVCYYPSPQLPIFNFRPRFADYPQVWSLDEIAHQHFLACAWLSFWCVEERGPVNWPIRDYWLRQQEDPTMPRIFDELLGQMALSFETSFDVYCQAQRDHIHEHCLQKHLFRVMLHMERVLFWLSRMGFGVSWSARYDQLLVRLFPEVYPDTLQTSRVLELTRLHSQLLDFQRPVSGPRHGPAPFEAPQGIPQLSSDLSVPSASEESVRFSTDGILEYLDDLASSDRQWNSPEETTHPGHILVGDELDLKIIAADLSPSNFLGTTLPTPPPLSLPTPSSSPPAAHSTSSPPIMVLETEEVLSVSAPSPPPASAGRKRAGVQGTPVCSPKASKSNASQPEGRKPPTIRRDPAQLPRVFLFEAPCPKGAICNNSGQLCTLEVGHPLAVKTPRCCSPCKAAHVNCPNWTKFSNVYEGGDGEVLRGFRIQLWEHLGEGSYTPKHPDPRWSDLSQTRLSTMYWEFLLLLPELCAPGPSLHRRPATSSLDSGEESVGSEPPTPKRRKMSHPQNPHHPSHPKMVEVTNEDDTFATVDAPQNYNLEEEDTQMLSPEPPSWSTNQASSSRMTLDNPPPLATHFLRFRLRPVTEIATASRSSLVEEIVQQLARCRE
ncbi:hypothetical protein DFH08DRAFT_823715 [Mycena albidolilacea]|uniref:Uncharacterized protein n=1 Tax=Mycena albidolilacea TaxID=1033008 RepID=A0AAD7EBQ5_9AGAR|nr:hypothetical protein DFH08DRAFT_823715 [Mycena albidolilacea]